MSTSAQFASEKEQLIALLELSGKAYLDVLTAVPESAASATLGGWTIVEVAEHVAVGEAGMLRLLESGTEKTTPADFELDHRIVIRLARREEKVQAPERSLPKGRWKSVAECADAFRQSRAKTIEFVKGAEGLRKKAVMHPFFGLVDGHQIALIMAHHPERHAAQIEEIKQNAGHAAATK